MNYDKNIIQLACFVDYQMVDDLGSLNKVFHSAYLWQSLSVNVMFKEEIKKSKVRSCYIYITSSS